MAFEIKDVPSVAITFLVIAIVLGIGATILSQFQDNVTADAGTTSVLDSNTKTTANGTLVFFADTDAKGFRPVTCTDVKVYNSTTDDVTAYFVISGCDATLVSTNLTLSGTDKVFNYTMVTTTYTYAYNTTEQGLSAQATMSEWQGTWVVIIASAVVLSVIGAYLLYR